MSYKYDTESEFKNCKTYDDSVLFNSHGSFYTN